MPRSMDLMHSHSEQPQEPSETLGVFMYPPLAGAVRFGAPLLPGGTCKHDHEYEYARHALERVSKHPTDTPPPGAGTTKHREQQLAACWHRGLRVRSGYQSEKPMGSERIATVLSVLFLFSAMERVGSFKSRAGALLSLTSYLPER